MKNDKTYNITVYTIISTTGIVFLFCIIFLKNNLRGMFGTILLFCTGIVMAIRSYKLENYLLTLDKKPRINFFRHYLGMLNDFDKLSAFVTPKFFFEKSDFEIERKQINQLAYLIYVLIICSIILLLESN